MKASNPKTNADLTKLIEKAAEFHGHLGPFLVIGVRIGNAAKKILTSKNHESRNLEATAKIQYLTPFSCIIDGVQITTHCTVGNQKLKIENSPKNIMMVTFKLANSKKAVIVVINQKMVEDLMDKFSQGASNEKLAWEIASMPENQLFTTEKL